MDPKAAYEYLLELIEQDDLDEARYVASALRHWFSIGGFHPYPEYDSEEVNHTIQTILGS